MARFVGRRTEGGFVLRDHRFKNFGDDQTRKIGYNGLSGEGETEPDQIMGGVADHRLIEVPDFDLKSAIGVGNRSKIADMTIPADPDLGALGDRGGALFKPFVKLHRRAAHIVQRGPRHFLVEQAFQSRTALAGRNWGMWALGIRPSSYVAGMSQDLPSAQNYFNFCRFELNVETLIEEFN